MNGGVDVLMITYNRPQYTRLSLQRLLDTAPEDARIWVWHNGTDEETLDVVRSHVGHPRFHQFHQSRENVKLTEPTNWLWRESSGGLWGKSTMILCPWLDKYFETRMSKSSWGHWVLAFFQATPRGRSEYRIVDLKATVFCVTVGSVAPVTF